MNYFNDLANINYADPKVIIEGVTAVGFMVASVLSIRHVKKFGLLRGDNTSMAAQMVLGQTGYVSGFTQNIAPGLHIIHDMPWGQKSHNVNILSGFDLKKYKYGVAAVTSELRNALIGADDDGKENSEPVAANSAVQSKSPLTLALEDTNIKGVCDSGYALKNTTSQNTKPQKDAFNEKYKIEEQQITLKKKDNSSLIFKFKQPENSTHKWLQPESVLENKNLTPDQVKKFVGDLLNTPRENFTFEFKGQGIAGSLTKDPSVDGPDTKKVNEYDDDIGIDANRFDNNKEFSINLKNSGIDSKFDKNDIEHKQAQIIHSESLWSVC